MPTILHICPAPGCGTLTHGGRCTTHKLPYRGWAQTAVRRQVLAEETVCRTCGQPPQPDDPLVAGHVVARAHGGSTTRANMRAEHRSCNARRGTN